MLVDNDAANLPSLYHALADRPPAIYQQISSPYWQAVLSPLSLTAATPPPPDVLAGVRVEMIDEGLDGAGKWYQTFRVTIRQGGTISDAAIAIFNDITRSDDVFRAAQQKNPQLKSPTLLFVGQEIDLTVDPSSVFVYKETLREQNGAVQKIVYYNGVVETIYTDPGLGVRRTVDFPAEKRTEQFRFPDTIDDKEQVVPVAPGTRLVDYQYVGGDRFDDVVNKVFGLRSAKAANELLNQTGWDPNQWPPATGAGVRVLINTETSYTDTKPQALAFLPSEAPARELWQRLSAEREAAGIFPVRLDQTGIVYEAQIGAQPLTVKEAAKLLFNDESKYLTVAETAGLPVPQDPSQSPQYNPVLTGRLFQILVPYADERFPYVERQPGDVPGALTTKLANGTTIEEYPRESGQSGLLRVVYFPNGYKYFLERPTSWTLLVLDFLHFQVLNIASPEVPREQRELAAREFQARMLWTWSRSLPRTARDTPDMLKLTVTKEDSLLQALAHPREQVTWQERIVYELWFAFPVVLAAGVVAFGTLVLFVAAMRSRRRTMQRRPRPR
ncbi:MAG: hypothetical protein ACYC4L_13030 [Chloroflexota bacterium]